MCEKYFGFDKAQLCFYSSLLQIMEYLPYSEISVTEIAAEAGKDRTTFYRYFECKEDLLLRCLYIFLDSAVYSINKPDSWNSHTIAEMVHNLFGILKRNKRALKILLGPNSPVLAREIINKTINEFWIKTLQNLSVPYLQNDNVQYISEFLGCCVMASIEFWMDHWNTPAREKMENDLYSVIIAGINILADHSIECDMIPIEYLREQETANAI